MTDLSVKNTFKILPIVPIRDGVVFPNTEMVLTFGRPRSIAAVEASNATDRLMVLVMQKSPHLHDPMPQDRSCERAHILDGGDITATQDRPGLRPQNQIL